MRSVLCTIDASLFTLATGSGVVSNDIIEKVHNKVLLCSRSRESYILPTCEVVTEAEVVTSYVVLLNFFYFLYLT